ncbi:tail fiber domain-containing protein [Methylobacterium sp. SD274]|uniref:tail fiber domain-containing protein n=1 Tax=Methylobacterium sp. SD274 TaxID=2782009 RepID=UPI001A96DBF4|nr:tail fiber domain-containing protein [Methylobacterium sp. SD274]MBO1021470.1 tail fiber domain-containing protein [Methylobacterium sp. SD274]
MGGGSKTQTTTQEQKSDPWAPAQPALQTILKGATDAYNSGVDSQVYTGPRLAGLGDTTQAGLNSMAANANGAAATAQAGNTFLNGLLSNGGTTAGTQSALNNVLGVGTVNTAGVQSAADRMADPNNAASSVGKGLVGGQYNLDGSGYSNLANGLGQGTQTQRSLQDVASGKFLDASNPYTSAMIDQGAGDAASKVAQQFAASGRYGSGRFAGAVADAADRVGTNLRYNDYSNERERQAAAANAIDSQANARTGVLSGLLGAQNDVRTANANQAVTGANLSSGADTAALTGASALAALQAQNNQQRLSQYGTALQSAQGDRASAQAGLGQVGGVQENLLSPGRTLAQVGAIQDAARQDQLDAQQQLFNEQQQQQWKQLGLLSGLASPIAGLGGTQIGTTTQQIPQPSMFQQILGGITGGAGALANIGKAAPMLAMLSDERAKDNVTPVGALNDGQTVYSYTYKGDSTPQIGLLAQEVARAAPHAVGQFSNGLLGVDYGRATERSANMGSRS